MPIVKWLLGMQPQRGFPQSLANLDAFSPGTLLAALSALAPIDIPYVSSNPGSHPFQNQHPVASRRGRC